ncbi:isochorismatase family protein [Kineococcus sp. SYSU DK002]|uniref:isochorismatase family protein n=1 Tax=Kineococcus sp. SYSU DK002 TaxID=3383123 RepID=UPI003D7CD676
MTTHPTSTQQRDYETAGYGHHLRPGERPALLLVDPARAYTDPRCSLYAGVEEPVAAMRVLLGAARSAGIPVVVTRVDIRPDGSDAGVFFRKVPALAAFTTGSPFAAYVDGLEPRPGEHEVVKQYPSAFFGTGLAAHLDALGVDTLLIAGLSTSGCVRASTLDAMQHGFVPVVVADAVGDRDEAIHRANLFDIGHKMGEVWSLAAALEHLDAVARPRAGTGEVTTR